MDDRKMENNDCFSPTTPKSLIRHMGIPFPLFLYKKIDMKYILEVTFTFIYQIKITRYHNGIL